MKPDLPVAPDSPLRRLLLRLGRIAALLLVAVYVIAVATGYLFLRYGQKIEEVRLVDVALFRFAAIRHTLARQQFVQAQAAWDAKNYQQAYVFFFSAVARDPGNIPGRLKAARFLASLGAVTLEVNLLEQGLVRAPDDRELNEVLFMQLVAAGRQHHALELLRGSHAAALAGPNAVFLKTVELQATLATDGAAAARALLNRRPELRHEARAAMTVARVCWEAGDRAEAAALLAGHVEANPGLLSPRLTLAGWQHELGGEQAAIDTAVAAVRQFPQEPSARVLLLEVVAGRIRGTPDWWGEIASYLRDFKASPAALLALGETAGRCGWLEVAATLYELGAHRGVDLGMLGLFYTDALGRNGRMADARAALGEVALQSDGRGSPFMIQLRQREIAVAKALGDAEAVRESSRRLAGLLRNDPDLIELYRGFYRRQGMPDVVAELSQRQPGAARQAVPEKPRGT